jgi:glycosyltransferase involved in cell wall biosynthesis
VLARVPSAKLQLVGRNPPAWLHDLAGASQGVEILGNVPDVRPMLAECGLMAVPLRIGGGSRLKILEALAMETPVVTTAVGCEGLLAKNGVHLVSTESIDAMAEKLVENIRQCSAIRAMASRGRQLVVERYDWATLSGKLEQVWYACAGAGARPEALA